MGQSGPVEVMEPAGTQPFRVCVYTACKWTKGSPWKMKIVRLDKSEQDPTPSCAQETCLSHAD